MLPLNSLVEVKIYLAPDLARQMPPSSRHSVFKVDFATLVNPLGKRVFERYSKELVKLEVCYHHL